MRAACRLQRLRPERRIGQRWEATRAPTQGPTPTGGTMPPLPGRFGTNAVNPPSPDTAAGSCRHCHKKAVLLVQFQGRTTLSYSLGPFLLVLPKSTTNLQSRIELARVVQRPIQVDNFSFPFSCRRVPVDSSIEREVSELRVLIDDRFLKINGCLVQLWIRIA